SAETLMSNDPGGSSAGGADGASIPSPLVATIVPEQILHDDELVLLLTKPSVLFIFYSSFPFLIGTLMLGVLAGQLTTTVSFLTVASVSTSTVLICLGRLIWALLVWTSHVYMLTNLRVVTIKGVVNVRMVQSQLRKIQ